MKDFFERNKIFLAIVAGALLISAAIYFSLGWKEEPAGNNQDGSSAALNNCQNIPELPDNSLKLATKVIDGDTFLIEGGYAVRILGIDADERDYLCYDEAKNRLEELILNQEVKLEKGVEDKDQYCRYLRYVFLPVFAGVMPVSDRNISLELVKDGLAVSRFSPENVRYREEITAAEKEARGNRTGCKWGQREIKEQKTEFEWEQLTAELTGLKLAGACQAGNYYQQEMIIEGKVVSAYRSKTNTVFLNFEKSYPNQCFTAVIFSSDQYKFVDSPEKYYANQMVRVRGEIKEYQGKPEIILDEPEQIEIGK